MHNVLSTRKRVSLFTNYVDLKYTSSLITSTRPCTLHDRMERQTKYMCSATVSSKSTFGMKQGNTKTKEREESEVTNKW